MITSFIVSINTNFIKFKVNIIQSRLFRIEKIILRKVTFKLLINSLVIERFYVYLGASHYHTRFKRKEGLIMNIINLGDFAIEVREKSFKVQICADSEF